MQKKQTTIPKARVLELWAMRDYAAVLSACDLSLEVEPLDTFYITFKGFSLFYSAMAEPDREVRVSLIDSSIFTIRRSLITPDPELKADALYVLGKAYYQKGSDYHDNALKNLEAAKEAGATAPDIWEYLALASYQAGLVDTSIEYFSQAISLSPGSAELLLAAALANFEAGHLSRSEGLAIDAAVIATDAYLKERCMFLLGDIYRNTGRVEEALQHYEAIKANNPESADAWYYEGLIYQQLGDSVKARASWRKAVAIDPMNTGARQKLAGQ